MVLHVQRQSNIIFERGIYIWQILFSLTKDIWEKIRRELVININKNIFPLRRSRRFLQRVTSSRTVNISKRCSMLTNINTICDIVRCFSQGLPGRTGPSTGLMEDPSTCASIIWTILVALSVCLLILDSCKILSSWTASLSDTAFEGAIWYHHVDQVLREGQD